MACVGYQERESGAGAGNKRRSRKFDSAAITLTRKNSGCRGLISRFCSAVKTAEGTSKPTEDKARAQ